MNWNLILFRHKRNRIWPIFAAYFHHSNKSNRLNFAKLNLILNENELKAEKSVVLSWEKKGTENSINNWNIASDLVSFLTKNNTMQFLVFLL